VAGLDTHDVDLEGFEPVATVEDAVDVVEAAAADRARE
jgi:hypothetical protein